MIKKINILRELSFFIEIFLKENKMCLFIVLFLHVFRHIYMYHVLVGYLDVLCCV